MLGLIRAYNVPRYSVVFVIIVYQYSSVSILSVLLTQLLYLLYYITSMFGDIHL